jgi:hypothetical protein
MTHQNGKLSKMTHQLTKMTSIEICMIIVVFDPHLLFLTKTKTLIYISSSGHPLGVLLSHPLGVRLSPY